MNDTETRTAVVGPLDQPVRPLDGPDLRRTLRAARLCDELGYPGDTLGALEELRELRRKNEELVILIQRVAKYPENANCGGTLLRKDVLRVAGPRESWKA